MRKSIILLSCVWQIGCGGHGHSSKQANFLPIGESATPTQQHYNPAIPRPLSEDKVREMVRAADDLALSGNAFPDRVLQDIKPVEIYYDLANVVVALSRDAHEEQGYYIVTPISSFLPAGHERGFSWERIDLAPSIVGNSEVYVYRRSR